MTETIGQPLAAGADAPAAALAGATAAFLCARVAGVDFLVAKRVEEFELLGVAGDCPGQAACPGREARKSLLRIRTAIIAVVQIEDALVRRATAQVVGVAAFPVIDAVLGGRRNVLDCAGQQ